MAPASGIARTAMVAATLMAVAPAPASADLFGTGDEVPPVPALTAEELVEALPRDWRGTFVWDGGAAYYVEVEIVMLSVEASGDIGFTAESRWEPGALEARMRGSIDPETLGLRIWEIPENGSADGFQSDGQYDGVLAPDLWDLRATWVTTASGETGALVLVAKALPTP